MSCFTRSIQSPGLGRSRSHPGWAESKRYGELIPAAIATNITKIIQPGCVNAKPRAVPRNGAVHGVARTVAKTPWKNEPASPSRAVQASKPRFALCGNEISKTPNKFNAKTSTTALMNRTK